MLLLATSQGKSKTSGGIISDSLDENKIRDRELLGVHQENTTKKRLRFTFTRLTNFYIGMSDEYLGR